MKAGKHRPDIKSNCYLIYSVTSVKVEFRDVVSFLNYLFDDTIIINDVSNIWQLLIFLSNINNVGKPIRETGVFDSLVI